MAERAETFPEWLEKTTISRDTPAWCGHEGSWRREKANYNSQPSVEPMPHYTLDPTLANNPMHEPLDMIGLVLWGVMYSLGGNTATPGGQLFNLYVLYVTAVLAGYVAYSVCVPPLVGMLLMGVLLRNVGFLSVSGSYLTLVTFLRRTALMTILTRAAIEFNPKNLERFSCVLLRLALLPSLLETVMVTILARYVLGLPWLWGIFLGITLASAAPAVTIPSLFGLQIEDYGTEKDIPALIIAASSFDDLVSLATFGIPLCVIMNDDGVWASIFKGPIRIVIGLTVGVTWGLLIKFVPEMYDEYVHVLRSLLLGLGGTVMLLTSGEYGFEGAGPIACMMGAFIACHGWRAQGFTDNHNPVANCFAVIWGLMQPILFSLIGGEIDLFNINGRMIALGAAVIYGGLLIRMLAAVWVSSGAKFNWKEKAFIAMSWFPKGTVQPSLAENAWQSLGGSCVACSLQITALPSDKLILVTSEAGLRFLKAALGPTALDLSRFLQQSDSMVSASNNFLSVVILAILLTAPLGQLLPLAGRHLLSRAPHTRPQSDTESIITVGAFSELASGFVNRGFIIDPSNDHVASP